MSFDATAQTPPAYLKIFWCWYDGVQPITCHEGQALAFIERSAASRYPIPAYVIKMWDTALAAAGVTMEAINS